LDTVHPSKNNHDVRVAEKLNLKNLEPLDLTEKHPIGNIGYLEQAVSVDAKFFKFSFSAIATLLPKVGCASKGR
jgi:hypothetical protein